jgi:hypothetical protein
LALEQFPLDQWAFEIIERLLPNCSRSKLREAEQRHIRRLNTCDPKFGFNVYPATLKTKEEKLAAGRLKYHRYCERKRAGQKLIKRLVIKLDVVVPKLVATGWLSEPTYDTRIISDAISELIRHPNLPPRPSWLPPPTWDVGQAVADLLH